MAEWMICFQWIIKGSILVTPVILIILVLRNWLKRISGLLMYFLWLVVWLRLICPVGIPLEISLFTLQDSVIQKVDEQFEKEWTEETGNVSDVLGIEDEQTKNGNVRNDKDIGLRRGENSNNTGSQESLTDNHTVEIKSVEQGDAEDSKGVGANAEEKEKKFLSSPLRALCFVWFAGIVFLTAYEAVLTVRLHKKLRFAVKEEKGVYRCNGISSAFVSGVLHSKIYLPFGIEERDKEYILAHEKVHIKHRDYLIKKICFGICLVYWFHPFVWLAYRYLCYDMEIACDEALLQGMDSSERKCYSLVLLAYATKGKRQIPLYQPQFGGHMTKDRIRHSIFYQKAGTGIVLVGIFVAVFVGILCMTDSFGSEVVPMKKGGSYTQKVEQLYELKVVDIDDKKAVKELLAAVISKDFIESYDDSVIPFSFQIKNDVLQIKIAMWISRPDSFRKMTGDYSALFLALISDIKRVHWQYEEVQYGGTTETVNLQYDWSMMQKGDFVDAAVCKTVKFSSARDFGASASSLQRLVDSFTYFEEGKTPVEKQSLFSVDEERMKEELRELPRAYKRSYEASKKCEELYIEGIGYYGNKKKLRKKEYRTKLWDTFYHKAEKGEAASVVVAGYQADAALDENGSVYYCYLCYDGDRYYALYDYVDENRADNFGDGMVSGKYLLEEETTINDIVTKNYYITDDPSLSYRDWMYAVLYGGMTEYVSMNHPVLYPVRTVFY